MDNNIVYHIHRGLHFLGLNSQYDVVKKDFQWGDKSYPIGSIFNKLGEKERTCLNINANLIFSGFVVDINLRYVLFEIESKPKDIEQLQLFEEEEKYNWYLAPMYVDEHCLLMPSSSNGFWDIKTD